jgi:hypothetical protein
MAHEVSEQESFSREIKALLKPHKKLLMSELVIHVIKVMYSKTLEKAMKVGFALKSNPKIFLNRSALFVME